MSWLYKIDQRIDLHVAGRIEPRDARRQTETATAILARLVDQPGVVLADEVGMGKTFVSLAVAASVCVSDTQRRPVVVMAPPILCEKWKKDASVFAERCLPKGVDLRCAVARTATEFLKLLDDPPTRRAQLIVLKHGCMNPEVRNQDGWVKLAILQRALKGRWGADGLRERLGRWADVLLRMQWVGDNAIWSELLNTDPSKWLAILQHHDIDPEGDADAQTDDDPVPDALIRALELVNLEPIAALLDGLPMRESANLDQRLSEMRRSLSEAIHQLWGPILRAVRVRLPLLILDEAHHLKNASTRLASLFANDEAREDADSVARGTMAGAFERMLFLTATPFQLGHRELCQVLERFTGVAWTDESAPSRGCERFRADLAQLESLLDAAQCASVALEGAWGRLREHDLRVEDEVFADTETWWCKAREGGALSPIADDVRTRFVRCDQHLRAAEAALRPWVLRHLKPRYLDAVGRLARRVRLTGDAIAGGHGGGGLGVGDEALMPFLLATRAVACSPSTRPVFAEGLASSFAAFRHTRASPSKACDEDAEPTSGDTKDDDVLNWYLRRLDEHLPSDEIHPKVSATARRVAALWESGEKVLVFCHYLKTGRILEQVIGTAINATIVRLGMAKLNCTSAEVTERLEHIGDRFFDEKSPLRRTCDEAVGSLISGFPSLASEQGRLIDVVRRFVRTPSFLVRNCPLSEHGLTPADFDAALGRDEDGGSSLRSLLIRFFAFLSERTDDERQLYLEALESLHPSGGHSRALGCVRVANGEVKAESRRYLMAGFNTPLFPEVLIASAVMAEGVDLHLNCRHIIHHDLAWNPSTLEQRTGRIDRVGARAEVCRQSIQNFLPYIGHTQDEKMFRVVTDRERWFQVVMGENLRFEPSADELERLPVPQAMTDVLGLRLEAFNSGIFLESEKAW